MKFLRVCLITSVVALFTSSYCHGQAALLVLLFGEKLATEKFHLTIDMGVSVSTLPGLEQKELVAGINFGMGTFIKLNEKWSLTPEFKPLSRGGAKGVKPIITDINVLNPESEFIFNYIDVPVLVQYRFAERFSVAAGPQISFLTTGKQETAGSLTSGENIVITNDIKSYMKKTNFSFPIQLSYSLASARGGKGVNIKARYNISTQEVFSNPELASSNNSRWQFFLSFPYTLDNNE
jgi:hypothetical protein